MHGGRKMGYPLSLVHAVHTRRYEQQPRKREKNKHPVVSDPRFLSHLDELRNESYILCSQSANWTSSSIPCHPKHLVDRAVLIKPICTRYGHTYTLSSLWYSAEPQQTYVPTVCRSHTRINTANTYIQYRYGVHNRHYSLSCNMPIPIGRNSSTP